MSGICGVLDLDGRGVEDGGIAAMTSVLHRRGPERTASWHEGPLALGHTLLATTPEAVTERVPLKHQASAGCVITADVRLDNREVLLGLLGERDRDDIGDTELILLGYLAWGERVVERLRGDFAFAIWDPRVRELFCARDQLGLRPFYYHHTPNRLFAFASEPEAIVVLPRVADRINEVRIADYLAFANLESVDLTSTFFAEVERLPPAHTLTVTAEGVRLRRYWQLEATDELRLASHDEYAEAFLEVLTAAVASRLRSAGPVGSMLSGGMDSGSVTAIAATLTRADGPRHLPTFSAVGPDPSTCVETRTIQAALEMHGLDPQTVRYDQLGEIDGLEELAWQLGEPFDAHMTLVRTLYQRASQSGLHVLLDGVGGDTVLEICDHLPRLVRSGHWVAARREAQGWNRFRSSPTRPWRDLAFSSLAAVAPEPLLRRRRHVGIARELEDIIQRTGLRREFVDRIGLEDRLAAMRAIMRVSPTWSYQQRRAHWMSLPHVTAARERYGRVAAAVGVEARDPFLDLRVMQFAVQLPGDQLLRRGWPKAILRRATAATLPRAVRDRIGKEHLGIHFTEAIGATNHDALLRRVEPIVHLVAPYVDLDRVTLADRGASLGTNLYGVAQLATWLHTHRQPPNGVPHEAGES